MVLSGHYKGVLIIPAAPRLPTSVLLQHEGSYGYAGNPTPIRPASLVSCPKRIKGARCEKKKRKKKKRRHRYAIKDFNTIWNRLWRSAGTLLCRGVPGELQGRVHTHEGSFDRCAAVLSSGKEVCQQPSCMMILWGKFRLGKKKNREQ